MRFKVGDKVTIISNHITGEIADYYVAPEGTVEYLVKSSLLSFWVQAADLEFAATSTLPVGVSSLPPSAPVVANHYRFDIGQEVIYTTHAGSVIRATVSERETIWGSNLYTLTTSDGYGNLHIKEDDLKPALYANKAKDACECGLRHSREGGSHSDWCPMYTPGGWA